MLTDQIMILLSRINIPIKTIVEVQDDESSKSVQKMGQMRSLNGSCGLFDMNVSVFFKL